MSFFDEYRRLNDAQKAAVDLIDGPLLVIAGPGTGKTQLLSARVANILDKTDVLPSNILCLTFTDNGAANMRERLTRFITRDAYDVTISTYHAFGGDLIKRFPEYFDDRLDTPVDSLTKHTIVEDIVANLPYSDALKQTRYHLHDLMGTISEMKQALLSPAAIAALAKENDGFYDAANEIVRDVFDGVARLPKFAVARDLFSRLHDGLTGLIPDIAANATYGTLAASLAHSLGLAIENADKVEKNEPLRKWKDKNLKKSADNSFVFDGRIANRRLHSLANVMRDYDARLREKGLYDFDDMILRSIDAIEKNDDLRFSLQEQYQYILLDEYQDTNAAQSRIVELLTDNPLSDGRPNVMAVGDDDQAIYAFQGAQFSNMVDFFGRYRDTSLINLTENYRSNEPILAASETVAKQIESRLTAIFPQLDKTLQARTNDTRETFIERRDFKSPQAERAFIAASIAGEINDGRDPGSIAVLAKKHATLEALVPYLDDLGVPISYEKRENILHTDSVRSVLEMARLVLALSENRYDAGYWPQVLAQDWWGVSKAKLWALNWKVSDERRSGGAGRWAQAMLDEDEPLADIALFFLSVAPLVTTEPCERVLDWLIGTTPVETGNPLKPTLTSPLRDWLVGQGSGTDEKADTALYDALSQLTVLRSVLRDYSDGDGVLLLADLLRLVDAYESAGERLLNKSPYAQSTSAVSLMTVYKAKGLEYDSVYLPNTTNEGWTGHGQSNKLTLPANLAPTRYKGDGEDENLRLFFVALTRARASLLLTSALDDFSGKKATRLKFLDESENDDGKVIAGALPREYAEIQNDDRDAPTERTLTIDWRTRAGLNQDAELSGLLSDRLARYRLSPTHLTRFIDLQYGGPEEFYFNTFLGFPSAPGIDGEFGNAVHETLEWVTRSNAKSSIVPGLDAVLEKYRERLALKVLSDRDRELLQVRGEDALTAFMAERAQIFSPNDKSEVGFSSDNPMLGDVRLGGKIDRLEIDESAKTITVVDYKTGSPHDKWTASDNKLHKYMLQLYCYKILLENSASYRKYTVTAGRLEFIEPDEDGKLVHLDLTFTDKELERTRALLTAMWDHVSRLDFPDTAAYGDSAKEIRRFEDDLIAGTLSAAAVATESAS